MAKQIELKDVDIYYGDFLAVEGVTLTIPPHAVTRSSARPGVKSRPSCAPLNLTARRSDLGQADGRHGVPASQHPPHHVLTVPMKPS
jgi:phosphate transport system ATP-binding protein